MRCSLVPALVSVTVLAPACGGERGGTPRKPKPSGSAAAASSGLTAAKMRERVKTFCGEAFTDDACALTKVGSWRGAMRFEAEADAIKSVAVELIGAASEAEAMRARALELVGDMLDDKQRPVVEKALARLFQDTQSPAASGSVGDVYVTAATGLQPAQPEQRQVRLEIVAGGAKDAEPLSETAPPTTFASPAKAVSEPWIADAKAACTEMLTFVSKTHQIPNDPPKWTQSDVHISCVHPNESAVAQYLVSWAPDSKRLLYARFVAELPQKKFTALTDRVLAPLLSPKQTTVMRTAAKKEPTDRKFEADGFQLGSRHETGGFYGETHELELSVQLGWTDSP